ncbi:hypothetical protein HC864_05445 [Candidatus Gracilibacteria bacterium]|nr:hypothetical protein [Candidatus Gracilibacteria bacterium]
MLGDNRSNSIDSRRKGAFADFSILGYETIRFWPFSEFKFFNDPGYEFLQIDEVTKSLLDNARQKQSLVFKASPSSNF